MLPQQAPAAAVGGALTLDALNAALADDFTSAPALRELLRRGAPPVPPGAPITSCPIYVLLESYELMLEMAQENLHEAYYDQPFYPTDELGGMRAQFEMELHHADQEEQAHSDYLQLMEVLVEAGYHPRDAAAYREYAQDGSYGWLWHAAQHQPWSPASHATFPRAFRAAARTLLLAARRHKGLRALPQDVLSHVLLAAAYPLSAWQPRLYPLNLQSLIS